MREGAPNQHDPQDSSEDISAVSRRNFLRMLGAGMIAASLPGDNPRLIEREDVIDNGDVVETHMSPEAHDAYEKGVAELREAARSLGPEKSRAFILHPDGTFEWLVPTYEKEISLSTPELSYEITIPDEGYPKHIQEQFNNGAQIEEMHSHPTKLINDKELPPSPIDIRRLMHITEQMKNTEDLTRYTLTAVAENGTWRYRMDSKEAAERLQSALNVSQAMLSTLDTEQRNAAQSFEKYIQDLEQLIEDNPFFTPPPHVVQNLERLKRLAHPETFHFDPPSPNTILAAEMNLNTAMPMPPDAVAYLDLLSATYEKQQDALRIVAPNLNRDPLLAPHPGFDSDYIDNWKKLGVTLTFTTFPDVASDSKGHTAPAD